MDDPTTHDRCDSEIYELQEKIKELKQELVEKNEEIENLKDLMKEAINLANEIKYTLN